MPFAVLSKTLFNINQGYKYNLSCQTCAQKNHKGENSWFSSNSFHLQLQQICGSHIFPETKGKLRKQLNFSDSNLHTENNCFETIFTEQILLLDRVWRRGLPLFDIIKARNKRRRFPINLSPFEERGWNKGAPERISACVSVSSFPGRRQCVEQGTPWLKNQ